MSIKVELYLHFQRHFYTAQKEMEDYRKGMGKLYSGLSKKEIEKIKAVRER